MFGKRKIKKTMLISHKIIEKTWIIEKISPTKVDRQKKKSTLQKNKAIRKKNMA
jgi:hypothetical protein